MIISVDHGFGYIKTPDLIFPAGAFEQEHSPIVQRGALEYKGRYFTVGGSRQTLKVDKTTDDCYFVMTLAAIALTLRRNNAGQMADVELAVGLPLSQIGSESAKFREYLMPTKSAIRFTFEGVAYTIKIRSVDVFPQGYAAFFGTNLEFKRGTFYMIDVGSWTVDAMRIDRGLPIVESFVSLPSGMIRCIMDAKSAVRSSTSREVHEQQVIEFLAGEESQLPPEVVEPIEKCTQRYVSTLIGMLMESGIDIRVTPAYFIGGGASVIQKFMDRGAAISVGFIPDPRLNARGYERLLTRKLGVANNGQAQAIAGI